MVPREGFEPSRPKAQEPKSCLSSSSNTWAQQRILDLEWRVSFQQRNKIHLHPVLSEMLEPQATRLKFRSLCVSSPSGETGRRKGLEPKIEHIVGNGDREWSQIRGNLVSSKRGNPELSLPDAVVGVKV